MEENPNAGLINDEEEVVDYDSDGNPIIERKKVQPQSLLFYSTFKKIFKARAFDLQIFYCKTLICCMEQLSIVPKCQ